VGAGGGVPSCEIFLFFYIKTTCSGALWSMDFKFNHVLLLVIIALVLIIKYRYST